MKFNEFFSNNNIFLLRSFSESDQRNRSIFETNLKIKNEKYDFVFYKNYFKNYFVYNKL